MYFFFFQFLEFQNKMNFKKNSFHQTFKKYLDSTEERLENSEFPFDSRLLVFFSTASSHTKASVEELVWARQVLVHSDQVFLWSFRLTYLMLCCLRCAVLPVPYTRLFRPCGMLAQDFECEPKRTQCHL